MSQSLWIISLLYGIMGMIYAYFALSRIIRRNKIEIFDFVRLMYVFVYGIIPCLIYGQESTGQRNLYFFDYSTEGIRNIFIVFFFSTVAYGVMNLAYFSVPRRQGTIQRREDLTGEEICMAGNNLFIMGVMTLLIGGFSLLLWTRAYGSISTFIENASAIRSGRGSIHNSYAFMKQFVKIMPLSLYALLSSYCMEHPRGVRKAASIGLIVISILGNYLYLMASDSRVTILFTGLAVVAILLRYRKKYSITKYLIFAGIISFVLLETTMLADTFTRYVRQGVWISNSDGFISNLTKEFRFILSADMKVMKAWSSGMLRPKLGDDILNAITSWIPERFIPFSIPETVWRYNTNIFPTSGSGTSPSALVSTGIYEIGILGALVHPFVFGLVTAYVDKRINREQMGMYGDVYYGVCVGLFIQMVSHNQMSTFVAGLFPAFLFFCITKFFTKVTFGGRSLLQVWGRGCMEKKDDNKSKRLPH